MIIAVMTLLSGPKIMFAFFFSLVTSALFYYQVRNMALFFHSYNNMHFLLRELFGEIVYYGFWNVLNISSPHFINKELR